MASTPLSPTDESNARRLTKSTQAYLHLRELILTLELEPGAPLDEASLTSVISLGRTPVREAIQRLAQEQLVVAKPGFSPYVAPIDLVDLDQIFEWRCLVEGQAAQLTAQRITPAQLDECRKLLSEQASLAAIQDYAGCVRCDFEFHKRLALSSDNRFLARSVEQVNQLSLRLWYVSFKRGGQLDAATFQHADILEAVAMGDGAAARQAMLNHIDAFRRRILSTG